MPDVRAIPVTTIDGRDTTLAEHDGKVKVVKLNVDDNPQTSARFQVLSIPTMLLFKDGEVVKQLVGAMPKGRLESALGDWVPANA